jgi:molybdenum cofactor cytidylyltransferase
VMHIGIVVLAAGRSARFKSGGASKLLAMVNRVPLVRIAALTAVESGVGEVIVVTGHRADEVGAALDGVPVRVVHEPEYGDGMAVSLRRGVLAVRASSAVMVGLGDQPGMRAAAYRRVAHRWRTSGALIVVPRYADAAGPAHPPLFAAEVFDELLALSGDVGAREVIARDPTRVAMESLEWPAPGDVDTREDLAALQADTPTRGRGDPRPSAVRSQKPDESR